MSAAPAVRGSGALPFCWIVLPVTVVSFEAPNPNGFSTTPTPTVLLLVTLLPRIVTSWPPTLRMPVPDGSNCRSSSSSSVQPGSGPDGPPQNGGNGFGRLFLLTVLPSIRARSVLDFGRPGSTITKIPVVFSLSLLPRTIESFVLSR